MPPSVTAVTAVTTADADVRTRVRAAHAIGARSSWRGAASVQRQGDSRSAVQALRTARGSQVRRTRVCERVLKNAFLDTTLRKLTVTHSR
jgi:hypothetical protein